MVEQDEKLDGTTDKPIRTQVRINLADEPEFAIVNKANLLTGA